MSERFFVEERIAGETAALVGPEAHHLAHVMRARPGDEVTLFDGSGAEWAARIKQIGRGRVELAVGPRREVSRELPFLLELAVALPKGDRQRWLVEKAVEVGVARLVPLATRRAVAQPAEGALARLRRSVIEAAKQCGRNRLMEIAAPQSWEQLIESAHPGQRLVAHPGGETAVEGLRFGPKWQSQAGALLAIGPEGGLAPEEVALAWQSGWKLVDLGPRILRVETAALLLSSAVILTGLGAGEEGPAGARPGVP
jgi:16S rRNA (uracil1498-N3)-methyltransferase